MMIRFLHTAPIRLGVDKSSLSKLRRKTGFPFINCRKALDMFNNDIKQAEAWLREEAQKKGWEKANKLADRPMSQGLIGIRWNPQMAAMVEVNCETDFVARNKHFQTLVCDTAASSLNHFTTSEAMSNKLLLDRLELGAVKNNNNQSLSDMMALTVGNLGENMLLQRGVCLKAADGAHIGVYVHKTGASDTSHKCLLGKYGCILAFQHNKSSTSSLSAEEIGRQLAQHVVGMNPSTVATLDEDASANKDSETAMIHQEFLLNPDVTVSEFLQQNSADIQDFIRFECGETATYD